MIYLLFFAIDKSWTLVSRVGSKVSTMAANHPVTRLVAPKLAEATDTAIAKFGKYISGRDPNMRFLKVSALLFQRNKSMAAAGLGASLVMIGRIIQQVNDPSCVPSKKLDCRSLVT